MLSLMKARLEGMTSVVVLMGGGSLAQVLMGEAKTTVMSTASVPVR
jgi:hypothetical protein